MKEKITYLDYNNVKYPMIFTLNVMEEIQNEYFSLDKWMDLIKKDEPNIQALKFGLGAMINEGIEIENETLETPQKAVTLKQVGRIITELGLRNIAEKIGENVVASTKVDDTSKNV